MKQPNIESYLVISALIAMVSCRQSADTEQKGNSIGNQATTMVSKDSVIKRGNVTITYSSNREKLGRFLDFKTHKPINVKFRYIFTDNSGQNERLSVAGPSDYLLEAILYFDSLTFEKLLTYDRYADYPSPNHSREEFGFDWLDKEILTELYSSREDYHGHPDLFFGTNGKLWYLDRKILISKRTN